MFKKWSLFLLAVTVIASLAACGGADDKDKTEENAASSVGESVDFEIVGIDPGAGLMKSTAEVIEQYELENWDLIEGSGAAMTAALKKAYEKEEPIIVTGWTPHWKFSKFDLKYLEDPKGIFGEAESIHTIVRTGLKEDHPVAYQILDQFNWTSEDMENVMVMIEEGMKPEEAASKWVEENKENVEKWTEGIKPVDGDEIEIAYVAWASEIASTNVVSKVLSDAGYDVTLRQVEAGPMWTGVADGSVDAHVAGWLPSTHEDYYNKYEGDFEDLGANLEGTKIGLVVPAYMDIDSIEDLKK
ncbi:glycine betaine ABC transporter substrate-binding protein [Cytobacillus sp. IB215665]|uniref:glycine betaine ABC transporter substrate-binding protein n=1 Tax=Cytobacillus sp. IB215665 TaxID=3097357 RepID=UPI002A1116FE|nr:glycine betaine ABC transporter substrate-binding protein [Cytobacillus sp. IB215665]MDX8367721.1 glycine betaine ABC transporter substrate-binding protein [Cytobacillus sp. IB215665]